GRAIRNHPATSEPASSRGRRAPGHRSIGRAPDPQCGEPRSLSGPNEARSRAGYARRRRSRECFANGGLDVHVPASQHLALEDVLGESLAADQEGLERATDARWDASSELLLDPRGRRREAHRTREVIGPDGDFAEVIERDGNPDAK